MHAKKRSWVSWCYEATLAALALASVWLLAQPDELDWVETGHFIIWLAFVTDYGAGLIRARDRRQYLRSNIFELIAIIPFDFLRIARLARVLRLLRVLAILWHINHDLRALLAANGLGYALAAAAALVLTGGAGIWVIEPGIETIADGIWWAVVTTTTVGYGDISPVTLPGRLLAATLMLVGISVVGMLTATLTTYFMAPRSRRNPTIDHIRARLEQWDELPSAERQQLALILAALAGKDTSDTPG